MEMTTVQRARLEAFANDQGLVDALQQLFSEVRTQTKPNLDLSNEQIGAILRAREEAKTLVDAGFRLLSQFKTQTIVTKPNPAR